ncbi:MAG: DMT family transporter [Anaerolineales bacterium]|nr:DMT family transporter [Anaerolineales bacterium]
MDSSQPRRASLPYLALASGIICLSFSAFFIRWAQAPGPVAAFFRLLLAAVLLTPIAVLRLVRREARFGPRGALFALIGGSFSALDFGAWSIAVLLTTASNATLLGNASPLWVALFALLVFREKLGRLFWAGLSLTLAGAILVMGSDFLLHPTLGLGDSLALVSSIFYAGYFLSTQHGRVHLDPLTYVWISAWATSLGLLILNLIMRNPLTGYGARSWIIFLASAIFSQILGYISMSYALGHLPASIVSPTMIGQPVLTTILAIPLLAEIPGMWQLIGGILVLGGIYLIHRTYNRRQAPVTGD